MSPDGGPFETPALCSRQADFGEMPSLQVNDASFIAHLQHNASKTSKRFQHLSATVCQARWQAGEVPFFKAVNRCQRVNSEGECGMAPMAPMAPGLDHRGRAETQRDQSLQSRRERVKEHQRTRAVASAPSAGGIPECSLPEVDVPESFDARQRQVTQVGD